jgi:hypothetical protein
MFSPLVLLKLRLYFPGFVNSLVRGLKVRALICGYMEHLVDEDEELRAVRKGIGLGCPLSPLMIVVFLAITI